MIYVTDTTLTIYLTEGDSSVSFKKKGDKTLAIINSCESTFSITNENSASANPLKYYVIKEAKENADYVLVIVHGGHGHFQLPSPRMKEIYRFSVDAGADAVVSLHQHRYSGFEVCNKKHIFYGSLPAQQEQKITIQKYIKTVIFKDTAW